MVAQCRIRTSEEIDAAFFAKVSQSAGPMPTPCWIWNGARRDDGYGVRTIARVVYPCHRWAYARWIGPISRGLFVCHKCDVRACCNPDHLFLGTRSDNASDAVRKGRMKNGPEWREECKSRAVRGESHTCARLTEEIVRQLKSMDSNRPSSHQLSKMLGVSARTIRDVWNGKTWSHVQ